MLVAFAETPVHAGNGKLRADGGLELTTQMLFPPTPEDLTRLRQQFVLGSRQLCDVTDGQIHIARVRVVAQSLPDVDSGLYEHGADIRVFTPGAINRPSSSGRLGRSSSRGINLTRDSLVGSTIAHELGHYVLGLRDVYDEQRRFGKAYGIGLSIDHGGSGTWVDWENAAPGDPLTTTFNTMMGGGIGQRCVKLATLEFFGGCLTNADCDAMNGETCELPPLSSEMQWSDPTSPDVDDDPLADPLFGNGGSVGIGPDECPEKLHGIDLLVNAAMAGGPNPGNLEDFDDSSISAAKASALAWEVYEYIDTVGFLPGYFEGSSRAMYLFVEWVAPHEFRLHLAMDGDDVDGFDDDDFVLVEAWDLAFDAANPLSISVEEATVTGYPIASIDGDPMMPGDDPFFPVFPPELTDILLQFDGFGLGVDPHEFEMAAHFSVPAGVMYDLPFLFEYDGAEPNVSFLGTTGIRAEGDREQRGICQGAEGGCSRVGCDQLFLWDPADPDLLNGRWEGSDLRRRVLQDESGETQLRTEWNAAAATMAEQGDPLGLVKNSAYMEFFEGGGLVVPLAGVTADAFGTSAKGQNYDCRDIEDGDGIEFDIDIDPVSEVTLVIDRSGSMGKKRSAEGETKKRIEWARAAGRAFAELLEGAGVRVGVVSFNEEVTSNLALKEVVAPDADDATTHTPEEIADVLDDLNAKGFTAIGDALRVALDQLQASETDSKEQAIFLLTDGEHNSGDEEPADVVPDIEDAGIKIYTTPLGDGADADQMAELADQTGGAVIPAALPEELPAIYAETFAALRGEQPALAKQETFVANPIVPFVEFELPVEPEAGALRYLLTNRNDEFAWGFPDIEVFGPNGEHFAEGSETFSGDEYYRLVRIPQPAEGTWRIRLTGNGPPLNDVLDAPQKNILLAHISNEGPDCRVWASQSIVPDQVGSVQVHAEAAFDGAVGGGVAYTAYVRRPDGTQVPLPMKRSDDGGAVGVFDAFVGRGYYEAVVKCAVSDQALFAPGEEETFQELARRGRPPKFTRMPSTWFFADSATFWDHGDTDCDQDGLPDIEEGTGDLDGDGIPDHCDDDTDGDDLTDVEDGGGPGSTNPGGGDPSGGGGTTFVPPDTDGDGVPDFRDRDSDNDGDLDGLDPDPLDPSIHRDDATMCETSLNGLGQARAQLDRGNYEAALSWVETSMATEQRLTAGWPVWSPRRLFLDVALFWEAIAAWSIAAYQPGGQFEGEEVFLVKAHFALHVAMVFKGFGCTKC